MKARLYNPDGEQEVLFRLFDTTPGFVSLSIVGLNGDEIPFGRVLDVTKDGTIMLHIMHDGLGLRLDSDRKVVVEGREAKMPVVERKTEIVVPKFKESKVGSLSEWDVFNNPKYRRE